MTKTLFQRIADRELPATIVFENEDVVAFRDIHPQAPVHILIVPRRPIPTVDDLEDGDAELAGKLLLAARDLARAEGLTRGYRLVINCRHHGCQTVDHLHVHLLGGRQMKWPPG